MRKLIRLLYQAYHSEDIAPAATASLSSAIGLAIVRQNFGWESRHSAPIKLPQLQNRQRKAKQKWGSIHSFQGAFSVLLFWQQDVMSCKRHRAPTQNLPDGPQGPQQGHCLYQGNYQKTAQVSNLFLCEVPIFRILPLLTSGSKPQKLVLY